MNGFRYALAIFSGRIILICSFETPAGVSKLLFHRRGRRGKRHLQCLFPAETSALRGCFLALNRSKKKHPRTPSGANAQTGRVAGAFFILGNSALAGLEVVHFLIGLIDQVVHGGDVRLKAGAADADLDLVGLAGGGVGGVQLPLDGRRSGCAPPRCCSRRRCKIHRRRSAPARRYSWRTPFFKMPASSTSAASPSRWPYSSLMCLK